MEFCFICPTGYLHRWGRKSTYHLVLAQVYEKDATYAEFYRQRVRDGDTVILDNGAYEGELMEQPALLKVVMDLAPTVVVLPDCPGNSYRTQKWSAEFRERLKASFFLGETMQVVHGQDGDLREFTSAYVIASLSNQWVALAKRNHYGLKREVEHLRRVQFIRHLKQEGIWRPWVKIHCLGMLDGCLDELPYLNAEGVVSCDSVAPVWRGLCGYRLGEKRCTNVPLDMSISPIIDNQDNEYLADENVERVRAACLEKRL